MGSTSWRRFVEALGRPNQPEPLPLRQSIQPNAPVAWGTEYLSEALADRAFAMQSSDSAEEGNPPPIGETGATILCRGARDGSAALAAAHDQPPCWYWWQNVPGEASPPLFAAVWHLVPGEITIPVGGIAFPTPPHHIDMSPVPAQLTVRPAVIAHAFPQFPNQRGLRGRNLPSAVFTPPIPSVNGWNGPFYKPRGVVACGAADDFAAQKVVIFNWIWCELPNPVV